MKWIMQSLYYIIIKPLPIVLYPDKIYFDYLKVSLKRKGILVSLTVIIFKF